MTGRHHKGGGDTIKSALLIAFVALAITIVALYIGGVNVFEWLFDLIGIEQDAP